MFLNPWYLQPDGAAPAPNGQSGPQSGGQAAASGSPASSDGREGSPAPSLMSCGSQGSTVQAAGPASQHLYSIQVENLEALESVMCDVIKIRLLSISFFYGYPFPLPLRLFL